LTSSVITRHDAGSRSAAGNGRFTGGLTRKIHTKKS
jgi:hypothetical protein